MDQREVIKKATQYKALLSQYVDFEAIILYGSHTTGRAREDSDIDIAVVVEKTGEDFFAINPLLWKLRRAIDDRIEPILVEKSRDRADFLESIKKTGIEV